RGTGTAAGRERPSAGASAERSGATEAGGAAPPIAVAARGAETGSYPSGIFRSWRHRNLRVAVAIVRVLAAASIDVLIVATAGAVEEQEHQRAAESEGADDHDDGGGEAAFGAAQSLQHGPDEDPGSDEDRTENGDENGNL